MTRARPFLIAMLALATTAVRTQQRSPTAAPTANDAGAASINGTVTTDGDPARPIARAVVTLIGAALRPALVVVADEHGRFEFARVPPGHVTVSASKPAYVTMSYGQTTPGKGLGLPILVEPGRPVADIVVRLPPASAISGRVLDAIGRPVRGAPVIAQQYHVVNGERALVAVSDRHGVTDAAGAYRLYGLSPGDYYVCALPPGNYMVNDPTFAFGSEMGQTSAGEIQWAMQQLRATDRTANAAVSAPSTATAVPEPPAGATVAYAPMYAPGAADPSAVAPVILGRGEDRDGVNIVMTLQPTARLDGRVVMPDGQPATNVMITRRVGNSSSTSSSADGTFAMNSLLPGRYGVSARAAGNTLWAAADIAVSGQNVTGLVLHLQPSVTVSGRVLFQATTLPPPAKPPTLWLRQPLLDVTIPVGADGTFQVATIAPGRYRIGASLGAGGQAGGGAPTSGWMTKSIVAGGRDITDTPVDIGDSGLTDLIVTLTDRTTELSGHLLDAAGQPTPGYYVVVFSTDQSFWRQGARQLPTPARTATDGAFKFTGLPAGAYYLAALTEFDPADLGDAGFLQTLVVSSVRVTLGDGEKKIQELRLR